MTHFSPRRLAAIVLLALAALAAAPAHLAAQSFLRGEVRLDGAPVAGVAVALHQVTRDTAGVIAASRTDARGGFAFELPGVADEAGFTVMFVTGEHLGVRYFGPPVHGREAQAGEYVVEVFDTTSVSVADAGLQQRRDMVLVPDPTGSWEVNEVVGIHNPLRRTILAADGGATWSFELPAGVTDFQVGEGATPADRVLRMGDRVLVTAPLTPGEHDVVVRYRIPPGSRGMAIGTQTPVDTLRVFVREPAPRVSVTGLTAGEPVVVEGERFARYTAAMLAPGAGVEIRWPSSAPLVDPVHAALGIAGALLLAGLVVALRRRSPLADGPHDGTVR